MNTRLPAVNILSEQVSTRYQSLVHVQLAMVSQPDRTSHCAVAALSVLLILRVQDSDDGAAGSQATAEV